MRRSRTTLANTDAAATEAHVASASTMGRTTPAKGSWGWRSRSIGPSIRSASGASASSASARCAATRSASVMPQSSHSSGDACPTAQAWHQDPTASKIDSRRASLSCLESRSHAGMERLVTRGRTSATPTVRGPAQAPRPTSSRPAISSWPSARRRRSSRRPGVQTVTPSRSRAAPQYDGGREHRRGGEIGPGRPDPAPARDQGRRAQPLPGDLGARLRDRGVHRRGLHDPSAFRREHAG